MGLRAVKKEIQTQRQRPRADYVARRSSPAPPGPGWGHQAEDTGKKEGERVRGESEPLGKSRARWGVDTLSLEETNQVGVLVGSIARGRSAWGCLHGTRTILSAKRCWLPRGVD